MNTCPSTNFNNYQLLANPTSFPTSNNQPHELTLKPISITRLLHVYIFPYESLEKVN